MKLIHLLESNDETVAFLFPAILRSGPLQSAQESSPILYQSTTFCQRTQGLLYWTQALQPREERKHHLQPYAKPDLAGS
ncbi:hypothetical protein ACOMHN_030213 [Nucella lapillus]